MTDTSDTNPTPNFSRTKRWLKRSLKIGLPVVFLAVAAGFVFATLTREPPTPPRFDVEPPALLVQVITMEREPVQFSVQSQGVVTPRTRTTIVSEVTGHIVEVSPNLESGGFFSKDEVLARIDPRNYETALKRAQADLAKSRTTVQTEQALAAQALDNWNTLQGLQANNDDPSDLTLRKPQLAEALAELDLTEAALEKAEEDLDRTIIRAPFDGMIIEKLADLGQFVNTGAQLARSVAVDLAEVRLPVSLKDFQYLDLEHFSRDRTVPVVLSADIGLVEPAFWRGNIVRSEGIVNDASRVVHVVAQVEHPYGDDVSHEHPLLFGTFVNAQIEGREAGDVFVLPRHAIYDGDIVWVVDDANEIYPRELSIIRSDRTSSYIADGIREGERICITPIDQPLPGMRVKFGDETPEPDFDYPVINHSRIGNVQ